MLRNFRCCYEFNDCVKFITRLLLLIYYLMLLFIVVDNLYFMMILYFRMFQEVYNLSLDRFLKVEILVKLMKID